MEQPATEQPSSTERPAAETNGEGGASPIYTIQHLDIGDESDDSCEEAVIEYRRSTNNLPYFDHSYLNADPDVKNPVSEQQLFPIIKGLEELPGYSLCDEESALNDISAIDPRKMSEGPALYRASVSRTPYAVAASDGYQQDFQVPPQTPPPGPRYMQSHLPHQSSGVSMTRKYNPSTSHYGSQQRVAETHHRPSGFRPVTDDEYSNYPRRQAMMTHTGHTPVPHTSVTMPKKAGRPNARGRQVATEPQSQRLLLGATQRAGIGLQHQSQAGQAASFPSAISGTPSQQDQGSLPRGTPPSAVYQQQHARTVMSTGQQHLHQQTMMSPPHGLQQSMDMSTMVNPPGVAPLVVAARGQRPIARGKTARRDVAGGGAGMEGDHFVTPPYPMGGAQGVGGSPASAPAGYNHRSVSPRKVNFSSSTGVPSPSHRHASAADAERAHAAAMTQAAYDALQPAPGTIPPVLVTTASGPATTSEDTVINSAVWQSPAERRLSSASLRGSPMHSTPSQHIPQHPIPVTPGKNIIRLQSPTYDRRTLSESHDGLNRQGKSGASLLQDFHHSPVPRARGRPRGSRSRSSLSTSTVSTVSSGGVVAGMMSPPLAPPRGSAHPSASSVVHLVAGTGVPPGSPSAQQAAGNLQQLAMEGTSHQSTPFRANGSERSCGPSLPPSMPSTLASLSHGMESPYRSRYAVTTQQRLYHPPQDALPPDFNDQEEREGREVLEEASQSRRDSASESRSAGYRAGSSESGKKRRASRKQTTHLDEDSATDREVEQLTNTILGRTSAQRPVTQQRAPVAEDDILSSTIPSRGRQQRRAPPKVSSRSLGETPNESPRRSRGFVGTEKEKMDNEGKVESEWEVRCLCGFTDDDGSTFVQCDECGIWQHQKCMMPKFDGELADDDQYFCEKCKPRQLDWTEEQARHFQIRVRSLRDQESKQREDERKRSKLEARKRQRESAHRRSSTKPQAVGGRQATPAMERYSKLAKNDYSVQAKRLIALQNSGKGCQSLQSTEELLQLCHPGVRVKDMIVEPTKHGLVTVSPVQPGTYLIELVGHVCLPGEIGRKPGSSPPFCFLFTGFGNGDALLVDARKAGNQARFVQRSCSPNAELEHIMQGAELHIMVKATKSIEGCEQVTIPLDADFLESTTPVEGCSCSTATRCPVRAFNLSLGEDHDTLKRGKSVLTPRSGQQQPKRGRSLQAIPMQKGRVTKTPSTSSSSATAPLSAKKSASGKKNNSSIKGARKKSSIKLRGLHRRSQPGGSDEQMEVENALEEAKEEVVEKEEDEQPIPKTRSSTRLSEKDVKTDVKEETVAVVERESTKTPSRGTRSRQPSKSEKRNEEETRDIKEKENAAARGEVKIEVGEKEVKEEDDQPVYPKRSRRESERVKKEEAPHETKAKNAEGAVVLLASLGEKTSSRRTSVEKQLPAMNYMLPEDRNKPSREERRLVAMVARIEQQGDKGKRGKKETGKESQAQRKESRSPSKNIKKTTKLKRKSGEDELEAARLDSRTAAASAPCAPPPRKRMTGRSVLPGTADSAALDSSEGSAVPSDSAVDKSPSSPTPSGGKKAWLMRHNKEKEEAAAKAAADAKTDTAEAAEALLSIAGPASSLAPASLIPIADMLGSRGKRMRTRKVTESQKQEAAQDLAAFSAAAAFPLTPSAPISSSESSKAVPVIPPSFLALLTSQPRAGGLRAEMRTNIGVVSTRLKRAGFSEFDVEDMRKDSPSTTLTIFAAPASASPSVSSASASATQREKPLSLPAPKRNLTMEEWKKRKAVGAAKIAAAAASEAEARAEAAETLTAVSSSSTPTPSSSRQSFIPKIKKEDLLKSPRLAVVHLTQPSTTTVNIDDLRKRVYSLEDSNRPSSASGGGRPRTPDTETVMSASSNSSRAPSASAAPATGSSTRSLSLTDRLKIEFGVGTNNSLRVQIPSTSSASTVSSSVVESRGAVSGQYSSRQRSATPAAAEYNCSPSPGSFPQPPLLPSPAPAIHSPSPAGTPHTRTSRYAGSQKVAVPPPPPGQFEGHGFVIGTQGVLTGPLSLAGTPSGSSAGTPEAAVLPPPTIAAPGIMTASTPRRVRSRH